MRILPKKGQKLRRFWNLSRLIAAAVLVAVSVAIASVTAVSAWQSKQGLLDQFALSAESISGLVASNVGGAVKFGKADNLQGQFEAFLDTHKELATYVSAFKADGSEIVAVGAVTPEAAQLAAAALSSEEDQLGANGFERASVVRFGKKNDMVGAVVIGWSDHHIHEVQLLALERTILFGVLVAAVFCGITFFCIHRMMSLPLNHLIASVRLLSSGQSVIINGEKRQDEIGALARELRKIYETGVKATRIHSALEGSRARLLVVDHEGVVVFASPAVSAMFADHAENWRSAGLWVDSTALVGSQASSILPASSEASGALDTLSEVRAFRMAIGAGRFDMCMSPIFGPDGARLGATMEWRDTTLEDRLQGEIDTLVAAAGQGDFSQRVDAKEKDGQLGMVGLKLNAMCEGVETFVSELETATKALSVGDMTYRCGARFEGRLNDVIHSVETAMAGLGELVTDIKRTEATIQRAVREVEAGSSDLSSRAETQTQTLANTKVGMKDMSDSISANAGSAGQASEMSTVARNRGEHGQQVVSEAVTAMGEIEVSSNKINDIISVIDGIAFQTNLLALNAAVEAARAGEAGKGFAVVASEVRTLAQRSADAARDISGLISTSSEKVADGVRLVNDTGSALTAILDAVQQVSTTIEGISQASRAQAEGVAGVNGALSEMEGVTTQNASLAEQSASAARLLREQSEHLTSLIGRFKVAAAGGADRQAA
ncbi:MAG: hypothetical protein KTR21_13350 [Rhodobacteraceae bacterium]|nr:hypothetical protein [Paracoccaceae bacterium]